MKFNEIKTAEDAKLYASENSLPKVPFTWMYQWNCKNKQKCIELTLTLQTIFNEAKEDSPFSILDITSIDDDEYFIHTSIGNFIMKYEAEANKASIEKTKNFDTQSVSKEKEENDQEEYNQKIVDMVNEVRQQAEQAERTQTTEKPINDLLKKVDQAIKDSKSGFSLRVFGFEIIGWN